MLLDKLEFWHNRASDTQFVWFPFLFLKPDADELIDTKLKMKMIICFGVYYGVFAAVRSWVFSGKGVLIALVEDIALSSLIFAIWFSVVTTPLWNRRAKKLRKQNGFKGAST